MFAASFLPPVAVILAAILWSLDGLLRQRLAAAPSLVVVVLEHCLGAILFAPVLFRAAREVRAIGQRTWISVAWVSLFGGIVGTFFYTKALSYVGYIDLSIVVLLQKLQPLFAISLAALVLGERITRKFLAVAVIALAGGYLVTFGTNSIAQTDERTLIAALMALCAAFAWGSSTALGKHALKKLSFFTLTALRLTVTSLAGVALLTTTGAWSSVMRLPSESWITLGAIVLSTGSVALAIYYYGLRRIPASHATLYELFWPLSAVAIDWVARGRLLTPIQFLGAGMILAAALILSREDVRAAA